MNPRQPSAYIDIHTHAERIREGVYIYNADPSRGVPVEPHQFISVGLHPWSLDSVDPGKAMESVELWAARPNVVAIGECGLDKLIATPLSLQSEFFLRHLAIAERVNKPLIVHCVRAHNELVRLLKSARHRVPVIVHGFNNNRQIATEMLKHGLMLSFGAPLLRPEAPVREVLAMCPEDRFFLETDDGDVAIGEIYRAAAQCRRVDEEALSRQIRSNFVRCFDFA